MNWKAWSIVGVGCLALTGACGDDDDTGGAPVKCPATLSELQQLGGKACEKQGEQCLDAASICDHNFSFECNNGKWEELTGLAAPDACGGAGDGGPGGQGGASSAAVGGQGGASAAVGGQGGASAEIGGQGGAR
jgi:hypothetical protein